MIAAPLCYTSHHEIIESQIASRLMNISLLIGSSVIMFLGFILLVTTTLFILNVNISIINILLSMMFLVMYLWAGTRCYFDSISIKTYFIWIIIILLILLTLLIVSGLFYDVSYDGQWYHQIAIIKLIDGWNPIYQTNTGQVSLNNLSELAITQISRFPKGAWIGAAVLFKLTNNLESCKALNLLLITASFFLSLAACLSVGECPSLLKSLIISSLVALNPVCIYQSLSFYVDGQLASVISCTVALVGLMYRRPHWLISLSLSMCLIILINLKFTGLIYALVLGVGFSALFMFLGEKLKGIKVMKAFSLGIVLGAIFVGYNPYVINTLAYANPFYPVLRHDIIMKNRPVEFDDLNRFQRFAESILSSSQTIYSRDSVKSAPSKLKVPFTCSLDEIKAFYYPDPRTGGFGPFFGGVFLVAIAALLVCFAYGLTGALDGIAVVFVLFLSAFSTTESWWARFDPQIWIVPIISIMVMLYNDKYLITKILSWSLCVILSINILLIGTVYVGSNAYKTFVLHRMLSRLAHSPHPVRVYFEWPSARIKLQKMGIRYEEVASPEELSCSQPINIPFTNAKVCPE